MDTFDLGYFVILFPLDSDKFWAEIPGHGGNKDVIMIQNIKRRVQPIQPTCYRVWWWLDKICRKKKDVNNTFCHQHNMAHLKKKEILIIPERNKKGVDWLLLTRNYSIDRFYVGALWLYSQEDEGLLHTLCLLTCMCKINIQAFSSFLWYVCLHICIILLSMRVCIARLWRER